LKLEIDTNLTSYFVPPKYEDVLMMKRHEKLFEIKTNFLFLVHIANTFTCPASLKKKRQEEKFPVS